MEQKTIMECLAALYPQAKKTTLRGMVEGKRVRLNGGLVKSIKEVVGEADKVEVVDAGAVPGEATTLAEGLRVIFFDSDIIIVEKPAGLLTSTDAEEKRPTAWRILQDYFAKSNHKNRVHLIHRLDRDASGLLIFGRSREAYTSLKAQFFEHSVTREYDVLVQGIPDKPKRRLEHLLFEDEQTGMVHVTKDVKKGKVAALDFEVVRTDAKRKLAHVKCRLNTGRKHQIRVQMKAMGLPICGDPVYGIADEAPGRLALHASHLVFIHPGTKRKAEFFSQMPTSFEHLMRGAK